MSEYQQKRIKSCLLPETVYRQALWAVKDLPRMRQRLLELEESLDCICGSSVSVSRSSNVYADRTAVKAGQMANLALRIQRIEDGLMCVPEQYRDGILDKLAYGVPYPDLYHANTWKRWQQVFLYQVAVNLQLY